jgi:hypothetical protein
MAFLPVVTSKSNIYMDPECVFFYLEKLSEDEINSIHSQHPTLTRDQILEWHKQFLNEQ